MTTAITGTATSITAGQAATAQGSDSSLDSNAFLKLLVAELQHQDPTKPLNSTELVQQLAAFSQVQQSTATNAKLSAILETISIGQAASVIGRTIADAGGQVQGVVEAVRLTDSGMVARLAGGREVLLSEGTTVSA